MNYDLMINNADVAALGGATFDRHNPMTGKIATTAAAGKGADVDVAVAAAEAAFPAWSQTGPNTRRTILNKAADILEARTPEFAKLGAAETGATAPWIGFNCMLGARILRESAAMTTQIKGEVIPSDKPGTLSMGYRQPVGVLVGMAPWNAPIILGVRSIAGPIACGNTVVMKASEKCPGVHLMIGECLRDAGLPEGVLNIVTHSADDAPEVVNALIDHPATKRINFTGSTKVGRIIAERAAKHLKPCLLELGGKAPLVVLDDADLDGAVQAAGFGAFMNQGQICMSTEKVIVDASIADAFSNAFATKAKSLKAGDPSGQVHLGSVVDVDTIDHLRRLIDDAVAKGAKVIAGGVPESGTVMQATIVDHVTPDMALYSDESFGPVTAMIRANDTDHAVQIANDTPYGLAAAVFGRDIQRAMSVARRIESGICHINGPTVGDEAQIPFGGVKSSGYGRFGGGAGMHEFTELRWITIEDPNQHYPI